MSVYLGLSLTVFAFVQPYRQQLYNYLDMLLTTGAVLLITTRNTREGLVDLEIHSGNNQVFLATLVFSYFPAVVFATCFLVAVVIIIVR